MTNFARQRPLFVPFSLLLANPFEVRVHISDPFWTSKSNAVRRRGSGALPQYHLQLVSMAAQLDVVLERSVQSHDSGLEGVIQTLVHRMNEVSGDKLGQPLEAALASQGLFSMFPEVALYFGVSPDDGLSFPRPKEYLHQLALISQTVQLCRQLSGDLLPGANQKYLAHQIALLYQCLNFIGPPAAVFKKRVEAEFQNIKGSTEQSQQPGLSEFHSAWYEKITLPFPFV
eukprot:TRINITY_DN5270_c0_g1_i1.p1 TRINITY_DN5270_c0_g1~~TRINITY_DN5270_c0_g1_i1.p1  ORF type:complete len:229 (+),score=12.14 TRINITY_DN5270_c0_g1_i1:35-721(+)